jgi:hypothetical protein
VRVGLLALVMVCEACDACSRSPESTTPEAAALPKPEPSIPAPLKTGPAEVHASGLTLLPQPETFRVQSREWGFRVDPANARRERNPWSVELRLLATDSLPDAGTTAKQVGEHSAQYSVQIEEQEGSGGALHKLTASARCGAGWLSMTAAQQAEFPARPDWSAAWSLMAASGCGAP